MIDLNPIYNLKHRWLTMTNEDRGLASADKEIKERVAREGGQS